MIFLQLVLGFGIGFSLGLLGGGGSILTVPALVYLVGQSSHAAVATSLAIVGVNSMTGAMFHHQQGTLNWRVAFTFGGAGMFFAYISGGISKFLQPAVLLTCFALLMLVIAFTLVFRRTNEEENAPDPKPVPVILASGAVVGLLTGALGVGGGFLIVPALTMLVGLPMQTAVGTSLIIIAMNSLAGFLGHAGSGSFDLILILIFTLAGLVGSLAGARLSNRISPSKLQKAFALFVMALALFLLYDNLPKIFSM